MLKVVTSRKDLDYFALESVYSQSVASRELAIGMYAAQMEFYSALDDFFQVPLATYGIWLDNSQYISAVRAEPYRDGFLFSCLETNPDHRNKGIASILIARMLEWLEASGHLPVYAHVHKTNASSLSVFRKCGFTITDRPAVFLDGSVYTSHYTLIYTK